jgi:hypothetical protein
MNELTKAAGGLAAVQWELLCRFFPASGGQTEIVNHPVLTFESEDDAAQKICTVLGSVTLQENLRQHLAEQAGKFSVEKFQASFRRVTHELMNRKLLPARTGIVKYPAGL